ncbi:MAG: MerR family transcriptional regulator [Bacteroides sp.]|nr:MerR family transcriptional regulator [Bacteroides sp.]
MEEQAKKLFYTIGEVAALFNVNTSLIRFWEKEFEVIHPQRNKKGNRLFTRRDLDYFHQIYHLVKEQGHTLQGAKEKLKGKSIDSQDARLTVAENLRRIKSLLLELKELC